MEDDIQGTLIRCPKCNGFHVRSDHKGFGLGKSIAGGLLLGPVGLLGGFVGSKKIKLHCLGCNHVWNLKNHIEMLEEEKRRSSMSEKQKKDEDKFVSTTTVAIFLFLLLLFIIFGNK